MLAGFASRYQLSTEQALKIGCAFGGGMASTAQMCGAVIGALMVLGLAHGRTKAEDQAAKEKTYAATRELWRRFEERHGSLTCRDLLGVNIGTAEGRQAALAAGLFRSRCPQLVRDAAAIVAELV